MEDKYIKGSRDNWEKIVLEYELLEAKHLAALNEQIEALRIENRNLNLAVLNHRIPPVPSNYVPMPSMCIPHPYESTEETDNET